MTQQNETKIGDANNPVQYMDGEYIGYGLTPDAAIESLHASIKFNCGAGLVRDDANFYWYIDGRKRKFHVVYLTSNHAYKAYVDTRTHTHA
jgi:hypothetical protein